MNTSNYNSIPQVSGSGGWEAHDREVDIARIIQRAETNRLTYKLLAVLLAGVLIAFAWAYRLEITPINHGDALGAAYMLNRWTGTLYFVRVDERIEVKLGK